LGLDLIEEEHATLEEAILSINDAIASHLEAASQDGFPSESLWRPSPQRYWKKLAQSAEVCPADPQPEIVPVRENKAIINIINRVRLKADQ